MSDTIEYKITILSSEKLSLKVRWVPNGRFSKHFNGSLDEFFTDPNYLKLFTGFQEDIRQAKPCNELLYHGKDSLVAGKYKG